METTFRIGSAALILAAAFFFWRGNDDGVFISIVLGCLSFFLGFRQQVKRRLKDRAEADVSVAASGDQMLSEKRTDSDAVDPSPVNDSDIAEKVKK